MALIVALLVLLFGIAGRMEYEDSYTYGYEWMRWEEGVPYGTGE